MALALQAHAKVLITTSSIQHFPPKAGQRAESNTANSRNDFLAALINQPSSFRQPPPPAVIENFYNDLRREFWVYLDRVRDGPFSGFVIVDYDTVQNDAQVQNFFVNAPRVQESLRGAQGTAPIGSTVGGKWREAVLQQQITTEQVGALVAEKSACDNNMWILSYLLSTPETNHRDESLHILRSMTIMSTILVEYIGLQGASNILEHVFNAKTLPHIVAMATSRAQKWGVEKDGSRLFDTPTTSIRKFLQWLIHERYEHYFTISIGSGTERAAGALVYAFVECLVHFGFGLALPAIVVHRNKVFAEVQRLSSRSSDDDFFDSNGTGSLDRVLQGVKPADHGSKLQQILEKEIFNDMLAAAPPAILGDGAEMSSLKTIARSTASQILMSGDIPPELVRLIDTDHRNKQSGTESPENKTLDAV